jgi:hypothetical protein
MEHDFPKRGFFDVRGDEELEWHISDAHKSLRVLSPPLMSVFPLRSETRVSSKRMGKPMAKSTARPKT